MKTLEEIQNQHKEWTDHNFPGAPDHHSLIGAFEEMGELAHAWLKRKQGIRGNEHDKEARDAIGDIIIYLFHFCSVQGWPMDEIINETWDQVRKRDWIKHPKNGKTE